MNIRLPLMGIDESVVHAVSVHAIKSIAQQLELRPMHIETEAEAIGYKNNRWIVRGKGNEIFGPHNEFIVSKIEEGITDTTVASSTPLFNVRPTIIEDSVAGLIARPWGTDSQMKITSVYFTKSKTDADTLITRLRYLLSIGQTLFPATLDYFYFPSNYFYEVIDQVLKNKMHIMDDYDEEDAPFHRYLKDIVANGGTSFSWSNTLALHDKKNYPVVREAQKGVHIAITSDMLNTKKEYDPDKGYWGVHFIIRFVYFKPQSIEMSYDISPYNNLLPDKFLGDGVHPPLLVDNRICIRYPQIHKYRFINKHMLRNTNRQDILHTPMFDHEHPRLHVDRNGLIVASILLEVSLGDLQDVCNLNTLGDLAFTPEVLEFISEHKEEVLNLNHAPFCIKLMAGDAPATSTVLTLDDALNLRTTVDMDPLVTYRLQVYYQTRANMLNHVGQRIYEKTNLFKQYMPIVKYIVQPDEEGYVPRDEFWYMTHPIDYVDVVFGSGFNVTACNNKDQPCP